MGRVAMIGAGAIGSFVASRLDAAGQDVTLCVREPIEQLVVEGPDGVRTATVSSATDPATVAPVDWVFLATKGQETEGAAAWLAALAGPETVVVVLQNGVDHRERVEPLAPGAAVLPALVYANVERLAPGHVRHRVGELIVVPEEAESQRLAELLAPGGLEVRPEADFPTAAWRKMLGNVAGNPLTALTLRRAEVMQDEGIVELARGLLGEAVAVGRAEGVGLSVDDVQQTLDSYRGFPPDAGTSMLFDRLAERRLEHELITGVVVRAGERHGISVPLNQAMLTLLRAVEGATERPSRNGRR